jgi:hypothetical protein
MLTEEQRRMADYMNLDPSNVTPFWVEIIDQMIHLREQRGEEAFQRELHSMLSPPEPTARDVMGKLKEIEDRLRVVQNAIDHTQWLITGD